MELPQTAPTDSTVKSSGADMLDPGVIENPAITEPESNLRQPATFQDQVSPEEEEFLNTRYSENVPTVNARDSITTAARDFAPDTNESVATLEEERILDGTMSRVEDRNFTMPSASLVDVDETRLKQVNQVAKALNISASDALTYLQNKPFEEVKAVKELDSIVTAYPGLYSWAQNPDNYKLLLKDPAKLKKVEDSSSFIKTANNVYDESLRLMRSNYYSLAQISTHAMVSMGKIDTYTASRMLKDLDKNIKDNQTVVFQDELKKFNEKMLELEPAFEGLSLDKAGNAISFLANPAMSAKDLDSQMKNLIDFAKSLGVAAKGSAEVLAAAVDNPGGFLVGLGGQSAYSMVTSWLMGGGATILTANPGIGLATGVTTQALVSYGQYFQQQADKFRNPKTGEVDYGKMYADPEFTKTMQINGAKYAGAHAVFEYVFGKFFGHQGAEALKGMKQGSRLARVANVTKAAAKASVINAAEEAGGETVAQLATGEPLSKALTEGYIEGLVGGALGIGRLPISIAQEIRVNPETGSIGPGTDTTPPPPAKKNVAETVREFIKAKKVIKDAEVANSQAEAIKESQQAIKESGIAEYQDQIKDLINRTSSTGELNTAGELQEQVQSVTIDINEMLQAAEEKGAHIPEILQSLGNAASASYYNAVANQIPTFSLPLSDFQVGSLDHDWLTDLVYVGESTMNAIEAKEVNALSEHISDSYDEKIFNSIDEEGDAESDAESDATISPDDTDIVAPGPGEIDAEGNPVQNVYGEDLGTVTRQVLPKEYRGYARGQMEAYERLRNQVREALSLNENFTEDQVNASTELIYQNTVFRAEMLGKSPAELANQIQVREETSKDPNVLGTTKAKYNAEKRILTNLIVSISGKAKIDTVLHEFGHVFLNNMASDYSELIAIRERAKQLTEAQQNYLDVMEITAEKLGLTSVAELLDPTTPKAKVTRAQESWAQTVEKFFLDGEAQSPRMKRVMAVMAKWLGRLGKAIGEAYKSYPALKIDDKVRRVMQTITRANSYAEYVVEDMFPGSSFDPRTLGQYADSYSRLLMEARAEAESTVFIKEMRKGLRDREALIDKHESQIFDVAREDISLLPQIQFRDMLQNGEPELRIQYDSFVKIIAGGDENLARQLLNLIPRKVVAGKKKAGTDIRDYMYQLEISSPGDMAEFLLMGGQEDALVQQRFDELVNQFFPPMKTDAEIHAEAQEALNGKKREQLIKMELKILANKSLSTLLGLASKAALPPGAINPAYASDESFAGVKHRGFQEVINARVTDFKPKKFLAQMTRYGRQAAKYVAKGEFEAALEMKEKEALYFYAYQEALKAKRKIDNTTALLKRFGTMSERTASRDKGMTPEFIRYIKRVQENFLAGVPLPTIDTKAFREGAFADDSFISGINERVTFLNNRLQDKPSVELTSVEEYMVLGDLVKAAARAAVDTRKTLTSFRELKIGELIQDMSTEIGGRRENDPTARMDSSRVAQFFSGFYTMENFIFGLFDNEADAINSKMYKVFSENPKLAETVVQRAKEEDMNALVGAIREAYKSDPNANNVLKVIANRFQVFKSGVIGKPIPASEIDATFSFRNKGEVLMAIMYYGSESGRKTLVRGGLSDDPSKVVPIGELDFNTGMYRSQGFEDFLKRAMSPKEGIITKADMDFVQEVWNIYEKHFEPVKTSIRTVFGFDIGHVSAVKIQTPWGEYRGGYVPLVRTMTNAKAEQNLETFTPDGMIAKVSEMFPFAAPSMSKERTGAAYPVSLDITRLRTNLGRVYSIAYMMPVMWDAAKVANDSEFRKVIEARRPGAMDALINPYIRTTLNQQYVSETDAQTFRALSRLAQSLRRNQAVTAFAFNLATIAKQQLGISPAAAIAGTANVTNSYLYTISHLGEVNERVRKVSPIMARRLENNATRAIEVFEDFTMNYDVLSETREKVERLTYAPIQMSQNVVDLSVFIAAEKYALRNLKLSPEKAIRFAESTVERTQGTTSISGRPEILVKGGEVARIGTAFSSQVLAMYSLFRSKRESTREMRVDQRAMKLAYAATLMSIIPGMVGYGISQGLKPLTWDDEDEKEKEEYLTSMAMAGVKESIDLVFPIVGNPLIEGIKKGSMESFARGFPAYRTGDTIFRGANIVGQGAFNMAESAISDDKEWNPSVSDKELKNLLDAFTLVTGVPASVINKGVNYVQPLTDNIEE